MSSREPALPDVYRQTWFYWPEGDARPAQPFIILTAYNPAGAPPAGDPQRALQTNEHANAQLKEQLRLRLASASAVFAVVGGSEDFVHQEPSWAACLPLADGIALGKQFRQDALFYVSDDTLYLVGCRSETDLPPEPIADWKSRQGKVFQTP